MTTDKELEDWINEFKRKDLNLDDLRFFYCKGYNKAIDKFEKMLKNCPYINNFQTEQIIKQLQELKENR